MAEPDIPELPAAITDAPQAAAMEPQEGSAIVKKVTHEVDTDDMFNSTT